VPLYVASIFLWICKSYRQKGQVRNVKVSFSYMKMPVIAQVCGQANTVTMWHDIDNDGQADYKATYVFKDGKLHQMSKSQTSQEELGFLIRRR